MAACLADACARRNRPPAPGALRKVRSSLKLNCRTPHATAMTPDPFNPWPQRWQRFSAACVRAFHAYAGWLIGISWKRFVVLSILLLISAGLVQNIPPFSWTYTTVRSVPVDDLPAEIFDRPGSPPPAPAAPAAPKTPAPPAVPDSADRRGIHIETQPKGEKPGVEISIDNRGVRIVPRSRPADPASAAASSPASAPASPSASPASGSTAAATIPAETGVIRITLPPDTAEGVREAVEEARKAIAEAVATAHEESRAARAETEAAHPAVGTAASREATNPARTARQATAEARRSLTTKEVHRVSLGEFLPSLAMLWIVASLIVKISYKRQVQAEAQAAQAVETAESESLKRQVVEARMAAMQAQVEPHFLFNTLASIDHLIETDPKRASQMQKNLIALLRASMPTMREANGGGATGQSRDLGRELAVIRPYLEILKVRMEERLTTEIDVPEGLLSAEFPPMMLQTLVENAIKHGLEPKPEGGRLLLRAEIVHGKLAVSVSDTGLGFGRAATAGTGVGLANIRERLQLLHGNKAALTITENPGGGTRVTLAVPYKPVLGTPA